MTVSFRIAMIRLTVCLAIAMSTPVQLQAQTLPLEVQIDMAILALEESIIAQDSTDILARIDALRALDPASADGELLFFEAEAAFAQNDLERAEPALVRFLSEVGSSSVNYQAALKLMLDVPRKKAEAEEAKRKAEEARKMAEAQERAREAERESARLRAEREAELDAERARKAAEAKERARKVEAEEAQLRAERAWKLKAEQADKARAEQAFAIEERALGLTQDEILHIRFVLQSKYGNDQKLPPPAFSFTPEERGFIADYYRERGIERAEVASNYLSETISSDLLETNFTPRRYPNGRYGGAQTQPGNLGGDWVNYQTEQSGRCQIESAASDWSRNEIFFHPVMNFSAQISDTGSTMRLNMVTPNPFRSANPVYAIVDNVRFELQIDNDVVKPAGSSGAVAVNNDVIRAIRASKESIRIYGTGALSGQPLSLGFSGWGFTAAFRKMMADCNRPGLASWIE